MGFFLLAQATPSYGKDLRVGFVDIQVAVSNTKEWQKEFEQIEKTDQSK